MLWRLKPFPANTPFFPSKDLQSLVTIHHVAPSIESSKSKSFTSKPFSQRQERRQSPKSPIITFLTPDVVRTTLQHCDFDLVALSYFLWCAQQPHYFHEKPTFRQMVPIVSNLTHRHGTVKRIVQELEIVGCIAKAQTFLLLMRIYWCGAMHDIVLEAFKEMVDYGYTPNTYVGNIVMDVCFKMGSVDMALRVLKETQSPNFLSFNIAVCNLCRLNDFDGVKGVLRCMLKTGYYANPKTYSLVLNCFCKFGKLGEALQLLGVMIVLGEPISVNVWSILIDGFCKSGHINRGAYLLEAMIKIGCSPNIVTCTSLIKGFLESQNPGKAFEILGTLESNRCFPDLVFCNVLIDCFSKMGWYNDAFEVFSSLRERSLVPDVYTYSSLVSTICLSRQYVLLPFLTSGLAVQPDLVVCNSLLSYFCKAGYPEGAIEFYGDMIDKGFLPDKYSFAAVLSSLWRVDRINEAVNVYKGMIRSHQVLDAHIHTIIVNGLLKSGSPHKAIRLFRKAASGKFTLDVMSYNVAISALIRLGQMEEAYVLFRQIKEKDIVPNTFSYNLILSGFCARKDLNMVSHILQEMVDRNIEIDNNAYKMMRNFLGKKEQVFFDNEHDAGSAHANDPRDATDIGSSSSDDLPDALVSVG